MGKDVDQTQYSREQRQQFRRKVKRGLDAFEQMLVDRHFEAERPLTGLEIELNLVDDDARPNFHNAEVLAEIADPDYQTELARFNIELNVDPRPLPGDSAMELETALRDSLNEADRRAAGVGSRIVMVGILPTLKISDYGPDWISENIRYTALNDSIFSARGEDIQLDIEGPAGEQLLATADSIAPESACTSVQLHLQVSPADFASHWNAAQAISAPQVALAANSPFFEGKRLWAETRIELFRQATDTRPIEFTNQGVRPRVFFGERWVTSIFDLFEENVRWFPALLAEVDGEDPLQVLEAGGTPQLSELNLHNGTIYRWNRPIYAVVGDQPHLRVENRVLPAGPTIMDTMANAAFYYGAVHSLVNSDRPVWSRLSFAAAEDNFLACAREGLEAEVYWPSYGELGVDELVLRHLLPLAHQGLQDWGVSQAVIDRYLGVIEARCKTGVNGAVWQTRTVAALEEQGMDREQALAEMTRRYIEHMHTNEPVHTWAL
ncbi:glutamate--cysteine ligase [Enemella evansiae]|uniref:Glutamate--cysteine ligase n=1 Tax=Enemella evansiae TaxID=2016499 RepID=A0A255GNA9_9ACTN|nr:glutamate-cysteine ligase family protein [Enemella evansiae]OYN98402.1 glutamate--cysteine ligase [Enemella evansiae]OYO15650.1 glutamate--cysteine ligase [Enemella evansiae]OYO15883.1 glutamate--cysteine ligase [Enemella evansiae]